MKTFTMLAAVAALAGAMITYADAQGTMGGSQSSSMGQGPNAQGSAKFCITMSASNPSLNCKYASMAACEKDAKAQNLQCQPNPKSSTTGQKQ